ncbi:cholesterol 7-desaturase nvd-like [Physella acuta]|uniref:cholesterol 7-desaturase nvd-like n=1 Tax=Physella acuta TaxID=109671 RepID=UPI0027DE4507|nr:cholesterol 7-desaturase nvd-like [Physella acuta]XP_059174033.1 cholesterol 7-desaturase nvd-like [Physella acuta]XP_059174035.1 cholesterol 7-desaturase nvd-like [Physella acuta]XP_059174036.1 cholesterol 7-desaturase nvd-like [Physella acuta]XP_059174037.1 cholesterol 7-desaturase nvd-like [Physella acuta]
MYVKLLLLAISGFLLIFVVSADITDTVELLKISLLDVGGLWVKAIETVTSKLVQAVTSVPDLTSPWTYVIYTPLLLFFYASYVVLFCPMNRVRKLGDVGYIPEGAFSVKETANFVQKRRKVGNVPPVYPNGWFGLLESSCLKRGEANTVSVLGQNLAVFRDEKGNVYALDAYCPHMGANMAAGGRVIGNCLECPFHAWKFRGDDGKCVGIPYTDKIPDIARVKSWSVKETLGWVFIWHHAEGLDPVWNIPDVDEVDNGSWTYRGRTEHHINAHIEEIPENGADVVHLGHVHGPVVTAGNDLRTMWNKRWAFASHHWTAAWEPLPEPDGHIGQLKLTHKLSLFGFMLTILDLNVVAQQTGPGIVILKFDSFFGKGMYFQTVTPQAPLVQRVVHHIWVNRWMPTCVAKFLLLSEALQVERDIMIWNNKQYEGRPLFVKSKEDTLISKHRRWYSQFYSENSPRVFQKDGLDF